MRTGVSLQIVYDYIRYTVIISDYLALYVKRGVFLLDYEHRLRVAVETSPWNEVARHDRDRFLVFANDTRSFDSSVRKPRKTNPSALSRPPRRKVLDSAGSPICYNYNMRKGCDSEACSYSHACLNCLELANFKKK